MALNALSCGWVPSTRLKWFNPKGWYEYPPYLFHRNKWWELKYDLLGYYLPVSEGAD